MTMAETVGKSLDEKTGVAFDGLPDVSVAVAC